MTSILEKTMTILQKQLSSISQQARISAEEAKLIWQEEIARMREPNTKAVKTEAGNGISQPIENHIHSPVPTAHRDETVTQVKRRLTAKHGIFDTVSLLFVTDEEQKLQGVVSLAKLLNASSKAMIHELMDSETASVHPTELPEQVAEIALTYQLVAVPVVNEQGILLGAVPAHTAFQLLHECNKGVWKNSEQALVAFEGEPLRRVIRRLPWLIIGTLGCILATGLMARFENTLRMDLAVAFFIPGIVYLADAIGTQSEAIAVRGLSFSNTPILQLLKGELKTGIYLGLALALIVFPIISMVFNASLAFAVSVALICASSVATSIGLLLPSVLTHLGKDPAYGSGPVATIIQDLFSLLIYLTVISLLIF